MKILHLDIETSPNTAHVWGLFKQTVALSQLMESSRVMCWAAKWDGEDNAPIFMSEHDGPRAAMIQMMWYLLDQADVVVHYNGTKFDIPTLNKEFLLQGLKPPSTYRQIDLLQTAKKRFRFPSNKLDYVSTALGMGGKVKHEGHTLWVKCMAGDEEAWAKMEEYNIEDVVLLEKLYHRLKPWITGHPNMALYGEAADKISCPSCDSSNLRKKGFAYTNVSKFQRYVCKECGTNARGRRNLIDRENILTGVV